MFGKGLVVGLSITFKRFFAKKITERYPEVKPKLPPRSHGSFDYQIEKCISCNLCINACPNNVIKLESRKDEKGKRIAEDYKMNLNYCLFCGLCVEACPTKALKFKTDFELACYHKKDAVFHWRAKDKQKEVTTNDDSSVNTENK